MGIYVSFWHGSQDGLLGHFLSLPHGDIEAWLVRSREDFPEDYDDAILPLLRDFRVRGIDALQVNSLNESIAVDRLLSMCYGSYCDQVAREPTWVAATGHLLRVYSYESILDGLRRQNAPDDIVKLWESVFTGRPFLRDRARFPFNSEDDIFRLGFWTAEETVSLQPWLQGLTDVDDRARFAALAAIDAACRKGSGLILTVA